MCLQIPGALKKLRVEADLIQTREEWECYKVDYWINERKTETIHQGQLLCVSQIQPADFFKCSHC